MMRPVSSASPKNRDVYLDCARGIGILLVVCTHMQRGRNDAHMLSGTYPFAGIDYTLCIVARPIFFLLAGLHVSSSLQKGAMRFLQSKLWTIAMPYFLWSAIQGTVQVMMSGGVNHPLHFSDWPRLFVAPIGQFWFLYALMVWHLLALVANRASVHLMILAILAFVLSPWAPSEFFEMVMKMGVFYAFGVIHSRNLSPYLKFLEKKSIFIAATLCFALAVVLARKFGASEAWTALPAAFVGCALVLAMAHKIANIGVGKVFAYLGLVSMPIYLMHILAGSGTRIVLMRLQVHSAPFHLVAGIAAGIMVPIAVHAVYQRMKSRRQERSVIVAPVVFTPEI